jgi:hypothetical protein
MDVCLLCLYVVFCVGSGLCDGFITRPEKSYRVSNCVWSINLNAEEDKAQNLGCSAIGNYIYRPICKVIVIVNYEWVMLSLCL